jgi:hypothetical protein
MTANPFDVIATVRLGLTPTLTLQIWGDRRFITCPIKDQAVFADFRRQIPHDLDEFKTIVRKGEDPSSGVVSWSAVSQALAHLHQVGGGILYKLLGREDAVAICNFMSEVWRAWPLDASGESALRFLIRTDEAAIAPLEFTPLIDYGVTGQSMTTSRYWQHCAHILPSSAA